MKKAKIKMNKPAYLGFSILEISKTSMYEFLYDYIKPKYQNNAKLCYIDTDSFIIQIKIEDVYEDIGDDVKKSFGTSYYSEDDKRPLGRSNHLSGDNNNVKKAKGTKNYVIKRILKFNDYKDCLLGIEYY